MIIVRRRRRRPGTWTRSVKKDSVRWVTHKSFDLLREGFVYITCDLRRVSCVSQSVVNVKPEVKEETEEEKEQKHKSFVEKNEKQIKHFGERLLA